MNKPELISDQPPVFVILKIQAVLQ